MLAPFLRPLPFVGIVQVPNESHGYIASRVRLSQPNYTTRCLRIYLVHVSNLVGSFFDVGLVNTDGIYPDHSFYFFFSERQLCLSRTLCSRMRKTVESHFEYQRGIAPDVGYCLIIRARQARHCDKLALQFFTSTTRMDFKQSKHLRSR